MPRIKQPYKTTRMNIELPEKVSEKVSELVIQLNALSRTEIVIRSISLLYAIKKLEKNSEFIIRSPGGKEKTIIIE